MSGRDAGRREAAAGDRQGRWMVPEELVGCGGSLDAGTEITLRVAPRLAEADAVAALDHDPVEHVRRPFAAGDLADDRGVWQPERRHEPVRLGFVPPRSSASSARSSTAR